MDYARNPSPIRSPIPGQIRCPSQSLKPYNRSHMQPALDSPIPDASLAVFPVNGENSHQGLAGRNPAPNQVREVCNFTVLLGLQSAAVLNRVGPRSTGKERDTESGNDYFDARYYSSAMGRFMSPDWSAKEDPVPYASLDDPQSLNLYSYVRNNPLTRVDADGHCDSNGQNCSLWDHVAGTVGGVLNVVPATVNLGVDAFNAVSSQFNGPQLDRMDMIQPDAHASMGGVQTGEVLQLALPAGDMSKGAQLLENAATGAAGEAKVAEELVSEGKTILGSHVGVQTDQGLRVVDHLVQDGEKMGAVEVKTGGATRSASQLAKDASMESKGGKIVGKNAPANLRGQTVKLPTKVRNPQP
jgi:RHS repeat-associated protein